MSESIVVLCHQSFGQFPRLESRKNKFDFRDLGFQTCDFSVVESKQCEF